MQYSMAWLVIRAAGRRGDFENGGGGHLQSTVGNLKVKIYNFFRHWYIPLHCNYIRDDLNICFSLYTIQDIA